MAKRRKGRSKPKDRNNNSKESATSPLPRDSTKPTFFDLPGEIRNEIYRLDLITHQNIVVRVGDTIEPPLLFTCHKIRTEATQIFYLENGWTFDLPHWKYSLQNMFFRHLWQHDEISDLRGLRSYWTNSGSYKNKTNLLRFIKSVHEGLVSRRLTYQPDKDTLTAVATGAFQIAYRMKNCGWEAIEEVLEIYLTQAAKSDGWKWE